MKNRLILFVASLFVTSLSMGAQTAKVGNVGTEMQKAEVMQDEGERHLVLHTMCPERDIQTVLDGTTWKSLDSLLAMPLGSSCSLKDIKGDFIKVSHGNINSDSWLKR